jgi:hypothetical protein
MAVKNINGRETVLSFEMPKNGANIQPLALSV